MNRIVLSCFVFGLTSAALPSFAQSGDVNFADRKAVIIEQPGVGVQLQGFSFKNAYDRSAFRLQTSLGWKNVSAKPVTAFEVVILRYDPFNRPIPMGGRWLVTGKNSGDWSALGPGESSSDGLSGFDDEPVLTSVVYIRAIRFEDGTVWMANTPTIEAAIRAKLPVLKQLGDVKPSIEKKRD